MERAVMGSMPFGVSVSHLLSSSSPSSSSLILATVFFIQKMDEPRFGIQPVDSDGGIAVY